MKLYPSLTPEQTAWLQRQPVFFVASAPLRGAHVNVSPKGMASSTFSVLGPARVAYLDRTGSGCETVAHLYENGRATVMFLSFGAAPRILRLFCRGRVVECVRRAGDGRVEEGARNREFDGWLARMGYARPDAVRSIIVLDVFAVSTSCGFGVPRVRSELYSGMKEDKAATEREEAQDDEPVTTDNHYKDELIVFEERPTLAEAGTKREKRGHVLSYQIEKSLTSLDGLPGLRSARQHSGQIMWLTDLLTHLRRILSNWDAIIFGFALAVLLYLSVFAAQRQWRLHWAPLSLIRSRLPDVAQSL